VYAGTVSTGCALGVRVCVCSGCDPYYWGTLLPLLSRYAVVCLHLGCNGRVCVLMWVPRGVLLCRLDSSS
jgi:hypothetical protein